MRIQVQHNSFVSFPSLEGIQELDTILPERSAERTSALQYIGGEAISDFVVGRLSDRLMMREFASDQNLQQLSSIPGYENIEIAAETLIQELESLPWKYKLFTAVPWKLSREIAGEAEHYELAVSPTLRLVRLGAEEPELSREPPDQQPSIFEREPQGINEKVLYLSETVEGYIPHFGGSTPVLEFDFHVRSFFGLTLALRLARTGYVSSFQPKPKYLHVYRVDDSGAHYEQPQQLPLDISESIDSMGVSEVFDELNTSARPIILRDSLAFIRTAFSESPEVLKAAQWLLDSYASKNQLLSFVQATIALEILFGEKTISDVVGLGELLSNRVSYLIGSSRKQRAEVLTDFRRIYRTRSQIVHRGHDRLGAQERNDLYTLRWICSRAIRKELELAKADQG